ncbi:hypothetical protein AB0M44_40690 [Streptosporangium subroseum]
MTTRPEWFLGNAAMVSVTHRWTSWPGREWIASAWIAFTGSR